MSLLKKFWHVYICISTTITNDKYEILIDILENWKAAGEIYKYIYIYTYNFIHIHILKFRTKDILWWFRNDGGWVIQKNSITAAVELEGKIRYWSDELLRGPIKVRKCIKRHAYDTILYAKQANSSRRENFCKFLRISIPVENVWQCYLLFAAIK